MSSVVLSAEQFFVGARVLSIGVNLSPGDWKSRLNKRWAKPFPKGSPPARTNEKSTLIQPAEAGFVCVAAVSTAKLP